MSEMMPVRVRVMDAWEDIALELSPSTRIGDMKLQALDRANVSEDPSRFEVKFRGARLSDEARSIGEAGVPPNGAVIVLRRRRTPVR